MPVRLPGTAVLLLGLTALAAVVPAISQAQAQGQGQAQAQAAKPAQGTASAAKSPARSPIVSQLRAQRVVLDAEGKESLEDASSVSVGDTLVYTMQHRNVSQRRLMQVDFGIPIPPGISYLEGSALPAGAKRVKLDRTRDQMVWRVEKLDPGDTVSMSLRVRIDPDPTLTPTPVERPKPAFRRQAP